MRTALIVVSASMMLSLAALAQEPDSASVPSPTFAPLGVTLAAEAVQDTVRRRAKAVDVSDAYEVRLRIHRYASYATIPLFLAQAVAGNQLFQADKSGAERPGWAKTVHSSGAVGLSALFGINTVTGLWNLYESRGNDVGRTKRLLHTALMLASDAGFAYTGLVLAEDAKRNESDRQDHRNYAYYSMGAAAAGWGVMLVGNH
ncbi:MAG: hypothetical protein ABI625_19445 [bacterium]